MKQKLMQSLNTIRGKINRTIKPVESLLVTKSTKPISTKFGFDRGKPIDRYWIEKFIKANKNYIKGRCLEIGDSRYTQLFGENRITKIDVLDIDKKNKTANIYADLRKMPNIVSNTYDCIILTHVLGMVDNLNSAVSELHRILKPGGTILATSASLSPTYDLTSNYWRFTVAGFRYLFSKKFTPKKINALSYGNVLTGQYFWVGLSSEDLKLKDLDYDDPSFPCIVAIRATK